MKKYGRDINFKQNITLDEIVTSISNNSKNKTVVVFYNHPSYPNFASNSYFLDFSILSQICSCAFSIYFALQIQLRMQISMKSIRACNTHLNNYFDFHVRLSIFPFRPCVRIITSIPAEVSQNVTNKDCLVCVKSKKYAS